MIIRTHFVGIPHNPKNISTGTNNIFLWKFKKQTNDSVHRIRNFISSFSKITLNFIHILIYTKKYARVCVYDKEEEQRVKMKPNIWFSILNSCTTHIHLKLFNGCVFITLLVIWYMKRSFYLSSQSPSAGKNECKL